MPDPGITITLREIYDSVQEVAAGVRRLNERINRLEDKTKESDEVDERSRLALMIAQEANNRVDKLEQNLTWVVRLIIGAVVTSGIGALFYLAQY